MSELIGYVDLTEFREISKNIPGIMTNESTSGNFDIEIFANGVLLRHTFRIFYAATTLNADI